MVCRGATGALLALLTLLLPAAAHAQALEVAPVVVDMPAGQSTATLSVVNRGGTPTVVQARAFAWDQAGADDRLTSTGGLAISPPISKIEAGATQLIRIAVRERGGEAEQPYRILLDELPPPAEPGAVRVALRISMPVFVQPPRPGKAELDWAVRPGVGGQPELVARNRGKRRTRLVDMKLALPGGRNATVEPNTNPYVLPGAERRWRLTAPAAAFTGVSSVQLAAETDAGALSETVGVELGRRP